MSEHRNTDDATQKELVETALGLGYLDGNDPTVQRLLGVARRLAASYAGWIRVECKIGPGYCALELDELPIWHSQAADDGGVALTVDDCHRELLRLTDERSTLLRSVSLAKAVDEFAAVEALRQTLIDEHKPRTVEVDGLKIEGLRRLPNEAVLLGMVNAFNGPLHAEFIEVTEDEEGLQTAVDDPEGRYDDLQRCYEGRYRTVRVLGFRGEFVPHLIPYVK